LEIQTIVERQGICERRKPELKGIGFGSQSLQILAQVGGEAPDPP